jgi:vitamin B12 transporter
MPESRMSLTARRILAASLLATALLSSTIAARSLAAQQAKRDTIHLPAEVVTATRDPGRSRNATASATVLDGNALRAEGVTTLAEALRRVPGLALARTSSFGSPTSLFLRGGQSNYVRVLVDGVPLNEPGGVLDLGRVPLDDVERIEVLRGPASVLYGSEAVTGVIQLFTRRATAARSGRLELGGGSYGNRRGLVGVSGGIGPVTGSLNGEHAASDGFLAYNNQYRNEQLSMTLAAGQGTATDGRLTARHQTSTYRYPTGSGGALEDRDAARTERRVLAGLDVGHRWSDRSESRVSLTASELRPRTRDGSDDAADTLGFYGFYARGIVVRRAADLRQVLRLGGATLALGGEWSRETERSSSVSQSQFGDFPDEFRAARETRALYAQGLGDAGRVSYSTGLRLDDNSAFGTFRTARFGASWRIAGATRLRASVGNSFKAPSFFENFATGFTVGNPALRPERARSADLGVETVVGNMALLKVTAFAQRFRDLIQYTGAPPAPGDPNYYNIAAANAGGVEVEVTLPEIRRFAVDFGYTWTDTRVVDSGFDSGSSASFVEGEELIRRPRHVVTMGVVRSLGTLGSLSARAARIGERGDRDFSGFPATPVTMPAYTLVDLGAELSPMFIRERGVGLQFHIENATDARIEQVAGFATPGRTLYAGLKLQR